MWAWCRPTWASAASQTSTAASARATLRLALDSLLRLLAPFLPYVTEEVWSWWHDGSVHLTSWPTVDEVRLDGAAVDPAMLGAVGAALATVRKSKSEAKLSMRAEVTRMVLGGPEALLEHVRAGEADLRAAGKITGTLDYAPAPSWTASDVELVPVEKPKPQG